MDEIKIQEFGVSEMYEWENVPDEKNRLAKFVTFSKDKPAQINLYGENSDDMVLGVTTINASITSDDPEEWKYKYMVTETGDILLQKEKLAVGVKKYDENLELPYIQTFPWEHFVKVVSKGFDETKRYTKRSNRTEWVRVNLLGKAIVYDNGKCIAGQYCTPYTGKIKDMYGKAVPAEENSKNKFYVLARLTNNAIMILNK